MLNIHLPAKFHMRFLAESASVEDIRTTTDIPMQYRSYLHPFSTAVMEELAGVDVLYQILQSDGFVICNTVLLAKEDAHILLHVAEPATMLQFMMKGSIRWQLIERAVWCRAGQFGFFHITEKDFKGKLEKGAVYEMFHVYLSTEQLKRLAPYAPLAGSLLHHAEEGKAVYLQPSAGIMDNRFYELVQRVCSMHTGKPLRDFTIPAYITLLINDALTNEELPPTDDDHALFAAIRAYIQNNLEKELGNSELAGDYCISVSKLKYGFKRIYNESLQAYVKRSRLERAKELISTTALPLQRVAQMVGYPDYGNFSRRYHAYFGYPPSERKRQ